jgi:transposase-like protein
MLRRSRGFWIRLVAEYGRSGLTHAEFAARRGVKLGTLRTWIYRLRRGAGAKQPSAAEAPPLLPVRVIASTAPAARGASAAPPPIEVELASGLRLRIPVGTDAEYVASLIGRLG